MRCAACLIVMQGCLAQPLPGAAMFGQSSENPAITGLSGHIRPLARTLLSEDKAVPDTIPDGPGDNKR